MRIICVFVIAFAVTAISVGAAEPFITGYAGNWSNVSGQPAEFFLSGKEDPNATLTIYDVLSTPVAHFDVELKKQYFAFGNTEPWRTGYGWEPTTLDLPALDSGLYYLNGPEVGGDFVPFIITEPEKQADIVVVYPTNTVNAYSQTPDFDLNFGPFVSLYSRGKDGSHPEAVSFQRPQNQRVPRVNTTSGFDKWLLENHRGDFKYISQADLEDYDSVAGARMVVIPGHSEYWTASSRRNFDRFVDNGGSALVISGNTMYRAVEYDDPSAPTELRFSPRYHFTDPRLDYPTWESIGVDFDSAGFGAVFDKGNRRESIDSPYDGWKLLDVSPSYFAGTGLEVGDVVHSPSSEYDGVPFTSLDPVTGPVIDYELLGFHRIDVIGFENTSFNDGLKTAGTWVDFQKTPDSGRVINVASLSWSRFAGDRELQMQLTSNMVDVLLIEQADFNGDHVLTPEDIDLLVHEVNAETPRMRFDLTEDGEVNSADMDRWIADFAGTWYGDAGLDGRVSINDLVVLAANFGQPGSWADGDFDSSSIVDFPDFLLLTANFGRTDADRKLDAASVPEPNAAILLLTGLIGCLRRCVCNSSRRRHAVVEEIRR